MKQSSRKKMGNEPLRLQRFVHSYQKKMPGKTVKVREYTQSYVTPRGPISNVSPDRLKKKSQTMWLMDRYGHFVGRANYEGQTSAKGFVKYGYDMTTTVRDAKKYKRIFGRTKNPRRQTRSY